MLLCFIAQMDLHVKIKKWLLCFSHCFFLQGYLLILGESLNSIFQNSGLLLVYSSVLRIKLPLDKYSGAGLIYSIYFKGCFKWAKL